MSAALSAVVARPRFYRRRLARRRLLRRLRWRLRRLGRQRSARMLAGVVAAMLALAVLANRGHTATPRPPTPVQAAVAPAGGYTPRTWASAFLAAIPEPQTPCNVAAIEAWEAAEGGAWGNSAQDNPLNTTRPEPGDWSINSVGVKAYPSWREGLDANVAAITNGLYGGILSALQAGNNAQAVANAVADSRWGTSGFSASC